MKAKKILKSIVGTLALPAIMYVAMMILCYANGKMYFGTLPMWRTLVGKVAASVTCAMGIGLQFKSGRFDFSGGAIMLVAAIIAGNVARDSGNSLALMIVLCIGICVLLSVLVALVYVLGRMPIIIVTIGMALLYESITCLIFGGKGVNLVSNMSLRVFVTYPYVLIPLAAAIAIYAFYGRFSISGKRAALLAHNQQAAVHIGVNEPRNVIVSYVYSGLIFGCATLIYTASGLLKASYITMSTVGQLFTNILPVSISLMLGAYCNDAIGVIMGSLTLCLMSYGLSAVFSAELGSAISVICTGAFILLLNVASSRGRSWLKGIGRMFTQNLRKNEVD